VGGYDCTNFATVPQADWHNNGNFGSWPSWQYGGHGGPWANLKLMAGTPLFGGFIGVPPEAGRVGSALNGLIDDLRVYSRALSPAEVDNLYQATRHDN
jgi:hypothetical protein